MTYYTDTHKQQQVISSEYNVSYGKYNKNKKQTKANADKICSVTYFEINSRFKIWFMWKYYTELIARS